LSVELVVTDSAHPFDPRIESLGLGGTIAVVVAILAYGAIAFFLREGYENPWILWRARMRLS